MPLNVVDTEGKRIPPARWTPEQRRNWVRQVLAEQRENHQVGRPIGSAALDEATKLAKDDAVLAQEVADTRIITSRPPPVRDSSP